MQGNKLADGRTAEIFAWGTEHILKLYRPEFPHEADFEFELVNTVCAAGVNTPAAVELVQVNGRFAPPRPTPHCQHRLPRRLPSRQHHAHTRWPHRYRLDRRDPGLPCRRHRPHSHHHDRQDLTRRPYPTRTSRQHT